MTVEAMKHIEKTVQESERIRKKLMNHIHKAGLEPDSGIFDAHQCMCDLERMLKSAVRDNMKIQGDVAAANAVAERYKELYEAEVAKNAITEIKK